MSSTRIAVVTAPNMRYVNTGMTTVELAAKCFIGDAAPSADITFYSVIPPNPDGQHKWMMMDLGYVHRSAHGIEAVFNHKCAYQRIDELLSSDLIVYWGDFLQARHYIESEGAGRIAALYGIEMRDALQFVYRALLQSGEDDSVREKTLIFGSSLLYNRAADYIHGNYAEDLTRLVQKAQLTLLRDPISATRVNHLSGDFSRSHLGIDPAFLLGIDDICHLPSSDWSQRLKERGAIGLFFGTRTEPPARLFQFCRALAKHLDVEFEWLPWFPFHEKLRSIRKPSIFRNSGRAERELLAQIEDLLPRGDAYLQGDLLNSLRKYALVITDTYHLCINSWNLGTPAICFGSERQSATAVIKDFKKRILYEMFDAGDFYFDVATLESTSSEIDLSRRILKLLDSSLQSETVRARMTMQANSVGDQLKRCIVAALG